MRLRCKLVAFLAGVIITPAALPAEPVTLFNASYDVTREFYKQVNPAFAAEWKTQTGQDVTVNQSHDGSSKQARAVIDGLEADVVTMNQSTDIDAIANAGVTAKDWAKKFPDNAAPYTSTIVFVVRRGNPKGLKNWSDLIKPGVQCIIPNPKTSGNGRYTYLAAWGAVSHAPGGTPAAAREFVTKLFKNVPVLDTGGRGATTTFAQRNIGDVLLTFENEGYLAQQQIGADKIDVVIPPVSILAEAPVAVVDKYVDKHGTRKVAEAYLDFLYSPAGQELAAKNFYRPRSPEVLARHARDFPALTLLTVEEIGGSWAEVQKSHFADGGIFDQIYLK